MYVEEKDAAYRNGDRESMRREKREKKERKKREKRKGKTRVQWRRGRTYCNGNYRKEKEGLKEGERKGEDRGQCVLGSRKVIVKCGEV